MPPASDDTSPDYAELAATLARCADMPSVAEAHGLATGMRVAGVGQPSATWRRELYAAFDERDVLANECRAVLDALYDRVFGDDGLVAGFALLLPEGIEVDAARVAAVRDWSQGFLFGFGLAGGAPESRLSAAGRELLRDFAEFTRLDTDDVENSAENQASLIEIEEYLRVGVMLLRDELRQTGDADESE